MKKVVAPRRPNVHAEVSGSTWIGLHGTSMWNGPCGMRLPQWEYTKRSGNNMGKPWKTHLLIMRCKDSKI